MAGPSAVRATPFPSILPWVGIVALVLAVLAVAQSGVGRAVLGGAGISAPPAAYTELFFDDASPLPATVPVGVTTPLDVAFVVGNGTSSPATVDYRVAITGTEATRSPLLAAGRVDLPAGARQSRSAQLSVRCTGDSVVVAVQVGTQPDPITHRIDCVRGGR